MHQAYRCTHKHMNTNLDHKLAVNALPVDRAADAGAVLTVELWLCRPPSATLILRGREAATDEMSFV